MNTNGRNEVELLWQQIDFAVAEVDHRKVVLLLKKLVDLGVWQALARIGEIYELGAVDVDVDLDEAIKWYRRAIFECDDPIAHFGLGRMYFVGNAVVEKDSAVSRRHLIKAYSNNVPEAGIFLGIMSMSGVDCEKDLVKAECFFITAAQAGFPIAYRYLAYIAGSSGNFFRSKWLLLRELVLSLRLKIKDRNHPNLWKIKDG